MIIFKKKKPSISIYSFLTLLISVLLQITNFGFARQNNILEFDHVIHESAFGNFDLGDYDNDGDLDLIILGTHIYENDGMGNFTINEISSSYFRITHAHGDVSWGDFDNDGDLDVIISGIDQFNLKKTDLYENLGNGVFSIHDSISETLINVGNGDISWGDYDNDGDMDVVISGEDGVSNIYTNLYENNGNGEFIRSEAFDDQIDITSEGSHKWGDYDNDGDLDLVIAGRKDFSNSPRIVQLFENNGDGKFLKNESMSDVGLQAVTEPTVAWGDYDNDYDLDLFVSGFFYENMNDGSFIFNSEVSAIFSAVSQGFVEWGDINNDGFIDIILSRYNIDQPFGTSALLEIYLNDGASSFLEPIVIELPDNPRIINDIELGAFNSDGKLDLIIALEMYFEANHVRFYTNSLDLIVTKPTAPTNLAVTTDEANQLIRIDWDAPTNDDGGSLSYNVHLVQHEFNHAMVSSQSDLSTGYHRVTSLGNAGFNTFLNLKESAVPGGAYSVWVQAINGAQQASAFTELSNIPMGSVFNSNGISATLYRNKAYQIDQTHFDVASFYEDDAFTLQLQSTYDQTIFIDQNDNQVLDNSEPILDATGFDINLLDNSPLTVLSPKTGYQKLELALTGTFTSDQLELELIQLEATPEIDGNANESGWFLLSNPFTTTVGEMLDNVWTQGAINSNAPDGDATLYTFNQELAQYEAITTDLDQTVLEAGEGLLAYLFYFDDVNDMNPIGGGWPKSLSNFGNPFGEQIDIPIKNVDSDGIAGTSGSEGYVLVGNPYGWPISVESVITKLKNADPVASSILYQWDPLSKNYLLRSTGSIQPYESFFIRVIESGLTGTLSFDYDDFAGDNPIVNKNVAGSSERINKNTLTFTLHVMGKELESNLWVQFSNQDDASIGIDPNDGYYLGSFADDYAHLYTRVHDQEISLTNLPENLETMIEIPIYLDATFSGDYELEWNSEILRADWEYTLTEVSSGYIIDMQEEDVIAFYADEQYIETLSNGHNYEGEGQIDEDIDPIYLLSITPRISTANEGLFDIPTVVELDQNYPNPFNPTSVIQFGVPNTAKVHLEVFDMLGRKVATLVNNETKSPGRYHVEFDARNLSSGMYVYRLVIGNNVLTKKMTLIK